MTHKYLIDGDLSISHLFRISNGSFIFIPFLLMKIICVVLSALIEGLLDGNHPEF